ncbi:aspartate aminotransferase family protein [Brevibacillus sp. SYSU BS000544]|uniref:aspartate aminotransferase family protein n=1 Tax=Brevibacillus sp. SYSU BS000544 TaxID=3416443 RepID=UPI003CE51DAE
MQTVANSCNLMNNYARWPLTIVKGQGNTVWDDQGNVYLDFSSGIAVTSLGHVPPGVAKRLHEQIDTLWHSSNLFQHPLQEQLATKLAEISGLDKAFFCNSGAEANEGAIKLARRYSQKVTGEGKYQVITFEQSFHGRTLATLTATGQDKVKDGFAPLPEGFITVPYNDLTKLKDAITDQTCAIMLELVQGEGGVRPADPAWVKELRKLCDEQGILLIVDEVQTGIGRTGTWFAFQQYDIVPDIVSLAKGLGSGFPVGAVLAKEKVAEAFSPGTHGTTFGGNPLAMTAGLATIEAIEQENLLDRVNYLHEVLLTELNQIVAEFPTHVKEVRGKGLLLGLECKQPVVELLSYAREEGIILLQAGPNVIRLLPSFITTEKEISHMADVLRQAFQQD